MLEDGVKRKTTKILLRMTRKIYLYHTLIDLFKTWKQKNLPQRYKKNLLNSMEEK